MCKILWSFLLTCYHKSSYQQSLYVTRYEKTYHSQKNIILQYGVQYLAQRYFFIFFSLQITKVWSFLYSIAKFHATLTLFSDSNSPEKEGGSVLASYVNGLTVLSMNKNLQTAIRLHSDTRATLRSYRLGVMAERSIDKQLAWRLC